MNAFLSDFEHPQLLIISLCLSLPIMLWTTWKIFPRQGDFLEALRYLYQPGWLSALRGEGLDDFWETMKLYVLLAFWAAIITCFYKYLQTHMTLLYSYWSQLRFILLSYLNMFLKNIF